MDDTQYLFIILINSTFLLSLRFSDYSPLFSLVCDPYFAQKNVCNAMRYISLLAKYGPILSA